ncbi:MAG: hypothetical protein DYG94_05700 [Leptolyngbya sp. PLA3]|nr:MAG: hypothetical protein EDM82_04420 [Cyanobacteria bacterium CYA]MCE7968227.1 hypothetical protein [Leptolyngbya sp. PL-A3]
MEVRTRSAPRHALVSVVVLASATQLVACTNHRRADFYAIRNIRLDSHPGDGSVIVRAEPRGLLAGERQALALRASAD